jgi:hypothetical protein
MIWDRSGKIWDWSGYTSHSTCQGISYHTIAWEFINDCAGKCQGFII